MLNKHFMVIVIFINVFTQIGTTFAQKTASDISQIKFLYEDLRYEEAIKFGQQILRDEDYLSANHLEYVHQYMAYSFYNIGKSDSARVHFLSLLSINPEIELNPLITSPKIIDFFNQTKSNFQEVSDNQNIISYPKYILIEDKRPDAAWRSAILPGWGQYYKGQPARAYVFGAAFVTSAAILGVSIVNENKYKDDYLESTDPDDIAQKYDRYNNWSKARQISTFTTIGIWLLSFADALWSDYPRIQFDQSVGEMSSVLISIEYAF
jgi:tetratricopeptide (TPR) repeat protein